MDGGGGRVVVDGCAVNSVIFNYACVYVFICETQNCSVTVK